MLDLIHRISINTIRDDLEAEVDKFRREGRVVPMKIIPKGKSLQLEGKEGDIIVH